MIYFCFIFPTSSFFILSGGCWRGGGCWFSLFFSTAFVDVAKCNPGVQHVKQGDLCKTERRNKVWPLVRCRYLTHVAAKPWSFRFFFSRSWSSTLPYLFLQEIQGGTSRSQSPAVVQSGNWSEPWGRWWGSPAPPGTRDAPRSSTEYLWTCTKSKVDFWRETNYLLFNLWLLAVNLTSVFECWVQWAGRCLCSPGQNPDQSIPLVWLQ